MNSEIILLFLAGLVIAGFLFSLLLDYLNLKSHKTELPEELSGLYDADKYRKSVDYHRVHWKFGLWSGSFNLLITLGFLLSGLYGWLDLFLREFIAEPKLISLTFFAIITLLSAIIHLPFEWYDHFVIEEKFGFNKMTLQTFVSDKVKGFFLGALIGLPLLWCFLVLTEKMGSGFWIWFGLIASLFVLLMNLFYTSLLLPLFNKLTPLQDGELKNAIMDYSGKVDFPVENIFVMDGSKRSGKANAFFSGFGKRKKIVLFDTLIEKHSTGELVAILAHEAGHYKKKHIILGFITSVIQIFFMLWVLSLFINRQELSFALGGSFNAIHLNLLAFGILFSPVSGIAGMASMVISRIHEFQADAYAKATASAEDLVSGLKKLSVDNLSNLTPHPLYVFFNYSHPPVLSRIRRLSGGD
jgi:STE24 endopeptidase